MKYLLGLLLSFTLFQASAQQYYLKEISGILNYKIDNGTYKPISGTTSGSATTDASRLVPLFVFNGESNSGGFAVNTDATATELSPRPAVKILNNLTFLFETLQIGVNNLIDHFGFTNNSSHGWELGLANRATANAFLDNPIYLVKTGQGGSKLSEWNAGGTYWTKFLARIDTARAQLKTAGKIPLPYVFLTIGINDAIAGTTPAAYETAMIAHIAKIRAKLGYVPILMPRFMSTYSTYNVVLDHLAALDPFNIVVSTTGATQRDANHWDYAGMKLIADNMINYLLSSIGQHEAYLASQNYNNSLRGSASTSGSSSNTCVEGQYGTSTVASFTSLQNANVVSSYITSTTAIPAGTGGAGGLVTIPISTTGCFSVVIDYDTQTLTNSVIAFLDGTTTDNWTWNASRTWIAGTYPYNGGLYYSDIGYNSTVNANIPVGFPMKIRFSRSGNDILYAYSADAGASWYTYHTLTNALIGRSVVYAKIVYGAPAVGQRAKVTVTQ